MITNKEFLETNTVEKKFVGMINDETCSSIETKKQIEDMITYEIDIFENNEKVTWDDFYDKTNKEKRTIFNFIIEDRKMRVDRKELMADRPPFAVCTFINNICERMELYEGHDALKKTYDLRSKRLKEEKLQDYLYEDPCAYDPISFLKEMGIINQGMDERQKKELLDILHTDNEQERSKKIEEYINKNRKDK